MFLFLVCFAHDVALVAAQVVAIAVFLALGFAFYVFFVPFVGRKAFQYVAMVLYTPLVRVTLLLEAIGLASNNRSSALPFLFTCCHLIED